MAPVLCCRIDIVIITLSALYNKNELVFIGIFLLSELVVKEQNPYTLNSALVRKGFRAPDANALGGEYFSSKKKPFRASCVA